MNIRRNPSTGEIEFSIDDPAMLKDAFREATQTAVGQEFMAKYFDKARDAEYTDLWRRATIAYVYKVSIEDADSVERPFVTTQQVYDALKLGMAAGIFRKLKTAPKLQEPAPVQDAPRRLSTEEEFTEWSDTHSSTECRQRAQKDAAYGAFYRGQFVAEINSTQVPDAVIPAGDPRKNVNQTQTLRNFAAMVQKEPCENLKPRGGYITLNGEQVPYSDFRELVDRCANAGLQI